MKKTNKILIGLLLFIIMESCSSNDPTSAAKLFLDTEIAKESNGYLKLVKFEKRDAVSQNIFGVEVYKIDYTGEVEAIKDGGRIYISNDRSDFGKYYPNGWPTNTETKIGSRYKIDGQMTLEKHENGWVK